MNPRAWRRRRRLMRFWGSAAGDIVLLFAVFCLVIGAMAAVPAIVWWLTFV